MATQNSTTNPAPNSQVNQKLSGGGGLTNLILMVAVIGLAVFGTLLSFQKGQVLNHTTELEKQTADINKEIEAFRDNKVEVSKVATDKLKEIEAEEIHWSDVISEAKKLIPLDSAGKEKVKILSYSGSGSGRVVLNVVTEPLAIPPFEDVARLISSFNNSVFFRDVYVPSIAKGQTESGDNTLSFILNMDYEKPETGSEQLDLGGTVDSGNSIKVPVSTENTPKVPRNN